MFQGLNKKPAPSLSPSVSIEGFAEKEAIALFQAGKIRKVENGEYLFRKGEPCTLLTFVLEGSFKVLLAQTISNQLQ